MEENQALREEACLVRYHWPGNVRELEHAIERAVLLGSGNIVVPEDQPKTALEAGWTLSDEPAKYRRQCFLYGTPAGECAEKGCRP